jgi:hypothetical protein
MKSLSIPAHFDGTQILLDENIELEKNARLLVTVLPNQDEEYLAWLNLSRQGIANINDSDEEEYSLDLIKEVNPEYEER